MVGAIRDVVHRHGLAFDDVGTTRRWLLARADCSGQVGRIGSCMGGGFALLMAASGDHGAASVNYGAVPKNALEVVSGACAIVATYGPQDRVGEPGNNRLMVCWGQDPSWAVPPP
ncbi:MAG: dienelactone hydrolase family protein [Nitriliruptoraceae bacterium]